ncbi:MAG: TonB-dependent receptor, partial [Sulfuricurvum sp.]|nr:TonB-dependent receptor [Sulfuricurvum sp.]
AQSGGVGQQSSFFLRGFSSEISFQPDDGIRYNEPTTTKGQAQLEHLMITDIDRIEIIKGAQGGIWGANSAAGVINILTKQANEKLRIQGNIEYGSYATTRLGLHLSQKKGALSYSIGASQMKTDGFSAITPAGKNPKEYESDGYINQTLHAKIGYELSPSDSLTTQANFINATTQYDGYNSSFLPDPNSLGREIHQINRLGSLTYTHRLNPRDSVSATYLVSTFDKSDPLGWTTTFKGSNTQIALQGNYHYAENGLIVAGGDTIDSKDVINAKELDSRGLFLNNTNRFNHLVVTESIRHDTYSAFNNKTTGKIGAKYHFDDQTALSTNYATAYRAPSLAEMYGYGGNVNLQPETTVSFDTSLTLEHLTITYYHNTVDNLIQYVYNPSTWSGSNMQVAGTSILKGYEVTYKNEVLRDLTLDLGYNRLWAKNQNNQDLQRRAQETFRTGLDYYGIPKLHLGLNAHYIGKRYDDLAKTLQTGSYTVWGAVINYDPTDTLNVYLKGDNLTDKLYQEVNGYASAGRSLYVGINAKF